MAKNDVHSCGWRRKDVPSEAVAYSLAHHGLPDIPTCHHQRRQDRLRRNEYPGTRKILTDLAPRAHSYEDREPLPGYMRDVWPRVATNSRYLTISHSPLVRP